MADDVHDLRGAERVLARSYPVRILLNGALLPTAIMGIVILAIALASQSVVAVGNAIVWIGVAGLGFWIVAESVARLGKVVPALLAAACLVAILSMVYWIPRGAYLSYDAYTHGEPHVGFSWALTSFAGVLCILVFWTIARGYWALFRLDDRTRKVLRAPFDDLLSVDAIKAYCGFPPITAFVKHDKGRVYIYLALSTVCFYLCFVSLLVPWEVVKMRLASSRWVDISEDQLGTLITAVVLFLLFGPLGNAFRQLGRKRIRFSIDQLTSADPRPPLLFLRAFREDQVPLPKPRYGWIGRAIAWRLPKESLDELLLEEGTLYGPVVALGSPRDQMPPYGAARGYFADKDWKQAVADLARISFAIVICLDETDAIWWEVEHLCEEKYLDKTLFLLPPKMRGQLENAKMTAVMAGRLRLETENPSLAKTLSQGGILGFFLDNRGAGRAGTSSSFSRDAYMTMLRLFLRSKFKFRH